ncbi:uncharacterized protein DUF3866 [Sediminihabitans luteus]|uniref:Uncharacterized protein DUF3866 n=1 Tax=Sediminihabitans luteus TaxID=1138585 RepID=A0A2M9CQR7_9CELL|nr:uncharacterized protein DUF3866 [Sediminihabitans luteus]
MVSQGRTWQGAIELRVDLSHDTSAPPPVDPAVRAEVDAGARNEATAAPDAEEPARLPAQVRALAYTDLVGTPAVGDRVTLNVSALARGLGTGGYALVVATPDTLPADPPPGPGHLVKARYTPLQALVLGADEQESPHHAALADADDLHGMPVVVADLHSALPAIVAGARHAAARAGRPAPRIAYVMTDGGALPAAFSRTVATLRDAGWIEACITTGQTYGGDHEAVTVHTGLLTAHLVTHADLAVVAQGPGNLGTGTRWGYSGVATGEALNAAATLRGRGIGSLRVSGADARDRHLGISHHTLTAYGRVAHHGADIPVPRATADLTALAAWGEALETRVHRQAHDLVTAHGRHRLVTIDAGTDLLTALRATPGGLSTMGRDLDGDPAAFVAAAVAGAHAADLAGPPVPTA